MTEQAMIRHTEKRDEQTKLSTLKTVRFPDPIKPGENLSLIISGEALGEGTWFFFRVAKSENIGYSN